MAVRRNVERVFQGVFDSRFQLQESCLSDYLSHGLLDLSAHGKLIVLGTAYCTPEVSFGLCFVFTLPARIFGPKAARFGRCGNCRAKVGR